MVVASDSEPSQSSVRFAQNPLYDVPQSDASPGSKQVSSDALPNSGATSAGTVRHRKQSSVGIVVPSRRATTPGLQFDVPATRAFVSFNTLRCMKTLVYNTFFPVTLPLVLALESKRTADNMSFLWPRGPFAVISW